MISLKNYGSDSSSSEDESDNEKGTGIQTELTMHLKPISTSLVVSIETAIILCLVRRKTILCKKKGNLKALF